MLERSRQFRRKVVQCSLEISFGIRLPSNGKGEEGTDNPEKKAGLVFMDWHGLNPDDSGSLGTLTFGGPLAVEATGKLTLTWGQLKKLVK